MKAFVRLSFAGLMMVSVTAFAETPTLPSSDTSGQTAMEQTTFNAATVLPDAGAAALATGGIRNVDSFDYQDLNKGAPIPEETMNFILMLDECVKKFGEHICKKAIANALAGTLTPEHTPATGGGNVALLQQLRQMMNSGPSGQADQVQSLQP